MRVATATNNDDVCWMADIIGPDFLYIKDVNNSTEEALLAMKNFGIVKCKNNSLFYNRDKFKPSRIKSLECDKNIALFTAFDDGERQFVIGCVEHVPITVVVSVLSSYNLPFVLLGYDVYDEHVQNTLPYKDAAHPWAHKKVYTTHGATRIGHMFCGGFEHSYVKIYTPKNNMLHRMLFNDFTY